MDFLDGLGLWGESFNYIMIVGRPSLDVDPEFGVLDCLRVEMER